MFALLVAVLAAAQDAPDAAGCAAHHDGRLWPTAAIQFASRAATLSDSDAAIAELVCALGQDAALTVQIEVHSDALGADAYNLKRTQDRANAVRDALIAAGVDGARVTAVGYGETLPIGDNGTAEGRAENRRVELHTEAPASRPPAPATPEPAPVPLGAPPPTDTPDPLCQTIWTRADQMGARDPGSSIDLVRKEPLGEVADRVATCLDAAWTTNRDGKALYARLGDVEVSVEATGDAAVITIRHRADPAPPDQVE